jgi:hypothetical protein
MFKTTLIKNSGIDNKLKGSNMNRIIFILVSLLLIQTVVAEPLLKINDKDYFATRGLSIFAFTAHYPEGHQGGIDIIQHGKRVATNGNLFLQPTPGQFQPVPKLLDKKVIRDDNQILVTLQYPDSSRMSPQFNPMIYPDLKLVYDIKITAKENHIEIAVDLDKPLPEKWVGRIGFNLELFPGDLFGKSFYMDKKPGLFPRYANTGTQKDDQGEFEAIPMAEGKSLTIAPENKYQTMLIESKTGRLQLIDGRVKHNNGWFVVREEIPAKATKDVITWQIKPKVVKDWKYGPVVHTSQLGYHPMQEKIAIIETDKVIERIENVKIKRLNADGNRKEVIEIEPRKFDGEFLRYNYFKADFSQVTKPGLYIVECKDNSSGVFRIDPDIYESAVWQPVLEYFLPIQMCHMKVFEKYRVWHDYCHLDDALMAPANIDHFDGYNHDQVPAGFEPYQHIDELNQGGWHDAGDYDIRMGSQLMTIYYLALAYEEFGIDYDQTTIDQENRIVEIHQPDGKPDALQQIEHGLLSVLGGYHQFGKLYRGIICPTLRQYVMLGDAGSMTDNKVFQGEVNEDLDGLFYMQFTNAYSKNFNPQNNYEMVEEHIEKLDDRLVFLRDDPNTQLMGVFTLAAAARALQDYNDKLAEECLQTAENLWQNYNGADGRRTYGTKIQALVELLITTGKSEYEKELIKLKPAQQDQIHHYASHIARVIPHLNNKQFGDRISTAVIEAKDNILKDIDNPFGIPYQPRIWGAGWEIQIFGVKYYFLYKQWPQIFEPNPMFNALHFVLGCHPGQNTASFASNVGTKSQTTAYGVNRADFSFYPGGVCSGTNLIRPDFPEMKDWPFLWQQTEYMIGNGSLPYMFLVLAVDRVLNEQ